MFLGCGKYLSLISKLEFKKSQQIHSLNTVISKSCKILQKNLLQLLNYQIFLANILYCCARTQNFILDRKSLPLQLIQIFRHLQTMQWSILFEEYLLFVQLNCFNNNPPQAILAQEGGETNHFLYQIYLFLEEGSLSLYSPLFMPKVFLARRSYCFS